MAELFSDILAKGIRRGEIPGRTQEAREWYRKQAKTSAGRDITAEALISTKDKGRAKARLVGEAVYGSMYFFEYEPKLKETLPYYDRFPLIFPINKAKGGILGINMHYLPPKLRAELMDALYSVVTNERYDESTRLALNYKVLNGAAKFRLFKPCVKHYLARQVRSRFIKIEASEWDTALFLPVADFQKQGTAKVWADSRRIARG